MIQEGPVGVACNSFTSASLSPPLVAFFVARTSSTWPQVRRAGSFVANVLGGHQTDLCRAFARTDVDRFDGVEWSPGETGAPRIDGAIAWIECDLHAVSEAGDHWSVLGAVRDLHAAAADDPLVFFRGGYHRLAA
jgi:flavin reductase (DIM6/NTAB) family NADH-FMN oxidoreductase RutF